MFRLWYYKCVHKLLKLESGIKTQNNVLIWDSCRNDDSKHHFLLHKNHSDSLRSVTQPAKGYIYVVWKHTCVLKIPRIHFYKHLFVRFKTMFLITYKKKNLLAFIKVLSVLSVVWWWNCIIEKVLCLLIFF